MTDPALLDCRGIVKSFPGVQALRGVDFAVRPGRVHGLVGENGAGKSTLAKIIAGLYPPDAGTLDAGRPAARACAAPTMRWRAASSPSTRTSTWSRPRRWPRTCLLDQRADHGPARRHPHAARCARRPRELLARYEIAVSPDAVVADLPNDQRKMVQIVKAISRRARVLLLDEPTSSLTDDEVRVVLRLIRDLAARAPAIVFISHYLNEVFEVCDEITVLRDGAVVLAEPTAATTLPDVVAAMIGRRLEALPAAADRAATGRAAARGARAVGPPWPARCLVHAPQGRDPGHHRPHRLGPDRAGQGDLRQPRHAPRVRASCGSTAATLRAARPERGAGRRHRAADQRPAARGRPAGLHHPGERGPADPGPLRRPAGAPRPGRHRRRRRARPSAGFGSARPDRRRRSARSAAATSRRCCSPSGWGPGRASSSWTSRPSASTSAPRPRSAS